MSEMLQVENAEFVHALLLLQLLIALITRSAVNVCAISRSLRFTSLVTNRLSHDVSAQIWLVELLAELDG